MPGVTGPMIKHVGCHSKSIRPEGDWRASVEQYRAQAIIESANNTLNSIILLQRIWSAEAQDHIVSGQKQT
jgi:hypothetical protein